MIGFLRGLVAAKSEDNLIIDVAGVGYNVMITAKTAQNLPTIGEETKVYTYLSVREDAMKLYGFADATELELFKLLIGVNGIGPKAGQAILGCMEPSELRFAILSGDAKTISKCPGIGAKTAQRVILDLKDKVDLEETFEHAIVASATKENVSAAKSEAAEALAALGYSPTEALKAVKSVPNADDMDVESLLKAALKYL